MPREIKAIEQPKQVSTSFDGSHTIEFSEQSHRYRLDGKPCVSVTTMLKGGLPTNQGLISWQKGQALEYLWNRTANIVVNYDEKDELFKKAKLADRAAAQEAADIGTILHTLAEHKARGETMQVVELLDKVRGVEKWPQIKSCFEKYLDWEAHNRGEFLASEQLIASPMYLFCGKYDLLSKRDGKIVLSDYKTSKGIYLEHKIQLAAYRLALRHWLDVRVDAIEILRFGKTGDEFETEYIDDVDFLAELEAQAIRCRETYGFITKNEKKYEGKNAPTVQRDTVPGKNPAS